MSPDFATSMAASVRANASLEKKPSDSLDEHHEKTDIESESLDASQGDEALRLVGAERSAQFSEEYNLRLRKKLVGAVLIISPSYI